MSAATALDALATDLRIAESARLSESVLGADGTLVIDVLRPCVGRGYGRRIYTAEMLRENAKVFEGWKMYVDHQSEEQRRMLGGLPRSLREAGGRVIESWWDANVPADPERGFGQGAVRARVKPVRWVRELIEDDPELVEASVNAHATKLRPGTQNGVRGMVVEGIRARPGTIDWVTEGGAGGKVAALMESVYSSAQEQEAALLDSMTDQELLEHLKRERPDVVEALGERFGEDPEQTPKPNEEEKPVDADALREALTNNPDVLRDVFASPEVQEHIDRIASERADQLFESRFDSAYEVRASEDRQALIREAEAVAERRSELRDLREHAHSLISEARLPDAMKTRLRSRYALVDGEPTASLNVFPIVSDDTGEEEKSAKDVLTEAVNAEIEDAKALAAELAPTQVRGQGGGRPEMLTEDTYEQKPGRITEGAFKKIGFSPEEIKTLWPGGDSDREPEPVQAGDGGDPDGDKA